MKQILIALVENKPGVLNRVASLFRRRNFNIESLVVGPSEIPGASRMTIVTDEEELLRRNIIKQNLLKMINVIEVQDVTDTPCVVREHVLVKVQAEGSARGEIFSLVDIYRGRIVDVSTQTLTIEATGDPDKIESLIEVFQPFGIVQIVRAGKVAMARGTNGVPELPKTASKGKKTA